MKLSYKERAQLWGDEGPYSEAKLIILERILDDSVSRVFIEVEVNINPFTFKLVKKNRNEFSDDKIIQQLLDHSDWRGQKFGYVSCAFSQEFVNARVMENAQMHLAYSRATIIKMHKFVLKIISNLDSIK